MVRLFFEYWKLAQYCNKLVSSYKENLQVKFMLCLGLSIPFGYSKKNSTRVVAVAQLVERSLPTPEVGSSNPVISKLLCGTFVCCQLYWKDENKEKEAGNGPFFKKIQPIAELKIWRAQFFTAIFVCWIPPSSQKTASILMSHFNNVCVFGGRDLYNITKVTKNWRPHWQLIVPL